MPWMAVLIRSNKEIAGELFIAEKTMNAPISNILAKLGLEDRRQPAAFAVKHGCE
jgi:two-component system response regulator DevR